MRYGITVYVNIDVCYCESSGNLEIVRVGLEKVFAQIQLNRGVVRWMIFYDFNKGLPYLNI